MTAHRVPIAGALIAAVALVVAGGSALATTIEGSFSLSGTAFSEPGLQISTDRLAGNFALDLNVGESATFDLFRIWTDEAKVRDDDLTTSAIISSFSLNRPGVSGKIAGLTQGNSVFFDIFQWGSLHWDEPLVLTFGKGGAISILLSNALFNFGFFELSSGNADGATVRASVTYLSEPAVIPLPASGALQGGLILATIILARARRARSQSVLAGRRRQAGRIATTPVMCG